MSKLIRVFPVETAMVPDFRAMSEGVVRFIGRRLDPNLGPVGRFGGPLPRAELSKAVDRPSGGFVHDGAEVELDIAGFEKEYLEEIRHGALLPADEESASVCGVPFRPLAPEASTTPDVATAA